jgi:hypothetical protein
VVCVLPIQKILSLVKYEVKDKEEEEEEKKK